jgi:hypothetical protein
MLDWICHIAAGWCMIGLVALALGPYRFKIQATIQYPCIATSSHSSNTRPEPKPAPWCHAHSQGF